MNLFDVTLLKRIILSLPYLFCADIVLFRFFTNVHGFIEHISNFYSFVTL